MIKRFRVQNYKALHDVTLDLTPVHVLIGPNDSGKTSILEALGALSRSVTENLSNSFLGKWDGRQLVWHMNVTANVTFEAEIQLDSNEYVYELAIGFQKSGRHVIVVEESFKGKGASDPIVLESRHQNFSKLNHLWNDPNIVIAPGLKPLLLQLVDCMRGVQTYRWVPGFLSLPTAIDPNRRFRMDPSGFGLASCLDDILGDDRDRFVKIESKFREVFPRVEQIKLVIQHGFKSPSDPHATLPQLQPTEGKGISFQFKGMSDPVPASQVSDGVLLILAYLTVLNLPDPPRLLLVEEPENGIHPKRLEEILRILRELVSIQDRTQVVFTTHSPYVLDFFKPEEVTLCHRIDDGSVATRRLSDSDIVRDRQGVFTLGEIWTGEGEDEIVKSSVVGEGFAK